MNLKRFIIAMIGISFLLCAPKASHSAPVPKKINPAIYYLLLSSPNIIILPPSPLPMNWIAGNLTANNNTNTGHFIAGYSVKVQLKDQSNNVIDSRIVALDANGQGSYIFSPALGTYLVSVVQDSGKICFFPPCLNPCFDGTTPAWHSVTLQAGSTSKDNVDFTVEWSLQFGGGVCWP